MTRTVLCGDGSKCQAQPGQGHRSQCPRPHHERRIPFRRLARIVTYFSMFCAGRVPKEQTIAILRMITSTFALLRLSRAYCKEGGDVSSNGCAILIFPGHKAGSRKKLNSAAQVWPEQGRLQCVGHSAQTRVTWTPDFFRA